MKNEAIMWCIENCSAYTLGEEAEKEWDDISERVEKLEKQAHRSAIMFHQVAKMIDDDHSGASYKNCTHPLCMEAVGIIFNIEEV